MKIQKNIAELLLKNGWNSFNYEIIKDSYINRLKSDYKTFNYPMNDELLEKISLLYNLKLKLEGNSNKTLHFKVNKIKKYKQDVLDFYATCFNVKHVVYLADINTGYLTVWVDEHEGVWAIYEQHILKYVNFFLKGF